jgi:stage IV sporulation protein FB
MSSYRGMRYTAGIGTYAGIPVRVHATFPLVLVLYAAIAAAAGTWRDGRDAAILVLSVFVCVILHEFGHCLQIKRYGIHVRDIVLFPIGGVARAEAIPENPRQEIVVAISGPLVNFAIAGGLFAGLALAGIPLHGDGYLVTLAGVNMGLGLFNLIPAFPMDGGRILRGVLHLRMPYVAATRRARDVGQIVALGFVTIAFLDTTFIMLAVVASFVFVGGMYEERAVAMRMRLSGRRAGDLADTTRQVFAATERIDAVFPHLHIGAAPAYAIAAESGSLAGVVVTADLLGAVRNGHSSQPLASIARYDFPVAEASTEATRVYRHLREQNQPFAAVVDGDRFVGLFHADENLSDFPRAIPIA